MKTIKLFIGLFLISIAMNAQTYKKFLLGDLNDLSNSSTWTIGHRGHLVLGDAMTSTWGADRLQIYSKYDSYMGMRLGNRNTQLKFLVLASTSTLTNTKGPGDITVDIEDYKKIGGNLSFRLLGNDYRKSFSFSTKDENIMKIYNKGEVVIGNGFNFDGDDNYLLYVGKGIKTERVLVNIASQNGWADYVFAEDYQLRSLGEVEEYIDENKHLPEVPSTEEVMENGVELKEMTVLLLKKVEELTLYTIEQEKKIEELKKELEELKK